MHIESLEIRQVSDLSAELPAEAIVGEFELSNTVNLTDNLQDVICELVV
jgi:hypothetical protein